MITAKNGPIDPDDCHALELLGGEILDSSPELNCCCSGCRSEENVAVAISLISIV
jgi:hypothetical protein